MFFDLLAPVLLYNSDNQIRLPSCLRNYPQNGHRKLGHESDHLCVEERQFSKNILVSPTMSKTERIKLQSELYNESHPVKWKKRSKTRQKQRPPVTV